MPSDTEKMDNTKSDKTEDGLVTLRDEGVSDSEPITHDEVFFLVWFWSFTQSVGL